MNAPTSPMAAGRTSLLAHLSRIRSLLQGRAVEDGDARASTDSTVDALIRSFSLTPFERDVVLLCTGAEIDEGFAQLCARNGVPGQPTFALALGVLPGAHWNALSTSGALRRYRLVEVASGETVVHAALRIDDRVLQFLMGVAGTDERLAALLEEVPRPDVAPEVRAHRAASEMLAARWLQPGAAATAPVATLCGEDELVIRSVVAASCRALGIRLFAIRAADVPSSPVERDALTRRWEREALLDMGALLVEIDDADSPEVRRAAVAFAERTGGLVALASRDAVALRRRTALRIDVGRLDPDEQRSLMREELRPFAALDGALDRTLDRVIANFNLGPTAARAACAEVRASVAADASHESVDASLWESCRAQARPRMEGLAQRIEALAAWNDLVLPDDQRRMLEEVAANVRQRWRVYREWGFASRGARGLGISALFCGASGTGKTMAAEVLAGELGLDLFRVDLSQIVSKYIGETEKNLRRIFDAADEGGTILLFDEADALFGKRSEVKDSHDRYANVEISYLLQRMETYRGLAILTSNMRSALDHAFLRRVRFVVEFPFPDAQQREQIWRKVFPAGTPTQALDYARLARLAIAGGNIKNIALRAAFLAADAGEAVRMQHLARAARSEFAKLERPFGEIDLGVRA